MHKTSVLRQELKYRISPMDRELLLRRLSSVMVPDMHGQRSIYTDRSLQAVSKYALGRQYY